MPSLKPQRNLRIDDDLYLKIKHIADENSRSFNKEVEFILKNVVKEYEQQHGEIKVNSDDFYE